MKLVWLRYPLLFLSLQFATANSFAATSACDSWPAWKTFKVNFLEGGRVIDAESPAKITTSEGQSYGLFFALVANDRESFEKILSWTESNLSQGDLTAHLPSWLWGHREDDTWGVMDANPAADADLWIAYTLGQAGLLWKERRYRALSQLIAHRLLREETEKIPGLGLTLLPAPVGFKPEADVWRLNPSYVPIQILRYFHFNDPESPWHELIGSSERLIIDSAPSGFSPDWVRYEVNEGFRPDLDTQAVGSYNAIRVYLWAGMLDSQEPLRDALLSRLKPMADYVARQGVPPEAVDTQTGAVKGVGPAGFSAALVPFLMAGNELRAAEVQQKRIEAQPSAATAYYNQSLNLFGKGWLDGYFRFTKTGALKPKWRHGCVRSRQH